MSDTYDDYESGAVGGGVLHKRVRAGEIEADPEAMAILVHYDVIATAYGPDGEEVQTKQSSNVKRIRLTSLNEYSNIPLLAEEIVAKCKLVHPTRLEHVTQLCYFLQSQYQDRTRYRRLRERITRLESGKDRGSRGGERGGDAGTGAPANIRNLDDYLEMLYEGTEKKIEATAKILELASSSTNHLEQLNDNATLWAAYTRVIQEDGRASTALMTNIIAFFFEISRYTQFRDVLATHKVGKTVMAILDYETERHAVWLAEFHSTESDMKENGDADEQYEKALKKLRSREKRQARLFLHAFSLLLNLAEDQATEAKMLRLGLVAHLSAALERRSLELLILVLRFLKKLSIFRENVDTMLELETVEKLCALLGASNEDALHTALGLMFNLAFDGRARAEMVRFGAIPRLGSLIDHPSLTILVTRVLYLISQEDKHKSVFTFSNLVPTLATRIAEWEDQFVDQEVMALAINLAGHARNAEILCGGDGLANFITRVGNTGDSLLMKLIRTCAQHPGDVRMAFLDYIDELVSLARDARNPDFQVEAIGVLGNLAIDNFNYQKLLEYYDLLAFMSDLLVPQAADDDIVLEAVIFIGTVAIDPNCAQMLAASEIIPQLMALIEAKQEDDELMLQICYAVYYLVHHTETRELWYEQQHALAYVLALLQDKNSEIRRMAGLILDVVVRYWPEHKPKVREIKFKVHNMEWLHIVEEEDFERRVTEARASEDYARANGAVGGTAAMGGFEYYDDDDDDEFMADGPAGGMYASWNDIHLDDSALDFVDDGGGLGGGGGGEGFEWDADLEAEAYGAYRETYMEDDDAVWV